MTADFDAFDVVVVGAGPAGSTLAWRLANRGLRVAVVEREHFPRHRVGESLTGTAGQLLRDMGLEDEMTAHGFPVKRGVRVYGPNPRATFDVPIIDIAEDGSHIPNPTWQVRRPEFDAILLKAATDAGAVHICADARSVIMDDARVTGLVIRTADGEDRSLRCRFLADASGFGTFLSKVGVLGVRNKCGFDKQIAFYAHVDGVRRDEGPTSGNTLLYYTKQYHWSWHIPVSDMRTSIGIVVPQDTYRASGLSPEAFYDHQLATLHPELADRSARATRVTEVWTRANYSYEIADFAGPGYAAIGDSHRFLDPIFSFGVWLGLKEAELVDALIAQTLDDLATEGAAIEAFVTTSNRAQAVVTTILDTFWTVPLAFLKLAHFTHKREVAELLAGRIFDPSVDDVEALRLMRQTLQNSRAEDKNHVAA
ncbi:NAD(P)/FAD-dependent oxidoreductase [Roseicyclus mahoneyensis]|uniref:Flavin-dependent dehydrogenase n=1 Tax=Roseicyclus mahoneyensis TaxID=164332 RepID=A0A316GJQ1_9RHOB|nr:NAD(P)/FAD-dependent oxidoreductase [Roseicyclus mahoneyensis]PWK61142.1 flavin-dependent dehydrogenase [Roseicyclus mahoneyensis]